MFFTLILLSISAVSAEDNEILLNDGNSVGQVNEAISEDLSIQGTDEDSTDNEDGGDTSDGDGDDPADDGDVDPTEWVYTIGAHYAASNAKISKDADASVDSQFDNTTDVEVVGAKSALVVYPVPATSTVTVKSADAINTVAIYTAAGVKVVDMDCDGENVVVVALDNLAAGNYFLKVNNLKPVRIVKL